MIIIASDGIWDKVDSKEAYNFTKKYYNEREPVRACDELIQQASRRWAKTEEVRDDITCVVIFIYK
jgi:serine/threonine protein phosphatase PrpC